MNNDSTNFHAHANKSFRFAQLSDPHLSSPGSPNLFRLLNKRVLGYLSWLRRRRHTHQPWIAELAARTVWNLDASHLVITGDLTHIGLNKEFSQVRRWLQNVGTPQDVTVIPGNHDLYVHERWDHSFIEWEEYMWGDEQSTIESIRTKSALHALEQIYPIVRIRENTAFIGISSVFAAPWFRATGKINQEQLTRLKIILQNPRLNQYCKVLLIHHPISTENTSQRKCLLNFPQLNRNFARASSSFSTAWAWT